MNVPGRTEVTSTFVAVWTDLLDEFVHYPGIAAALQDRFCKDSNLVDEPVETTTERPNTRQRLRRPEPSVQRCKDIRWTCQIPLGFSVEAKLDIDAAPGTSVRDMTSHSRDLARVSRVPLRTCIPPSMCGLGRLKFGMLWLIGFSPILVPPMCSMNPTGRPTWRLPEPTSS